MKTHRQVAVIIAAFCVAAPAWTITAKPAFVGAYAGPEFGVHEHHFFLEERIPTTGASRGKYYRAWGIGGGAFADYEFAVSPRLRLGGEAGVSVGGNNPVARFANGSICTQHPQYGYRVTARAGLILNPRLLAYGSSDMAGIAIGWKVPPPFRMSTLGVAAPRLVPAWNIGLASAPACGSISGISTIR